MLTGMHYNSEWKEVRFLTGRPTLICRLTRLVVYLAILNFKYAEGSVEDQRVGCFEERSSGRVMNVSATPRPNARTIVNCISDCGNLGYTYASGFPICKCWCGHDYYNVSSNRCHSAARCCGEQSQRCVNLRQSVNSVYAVCPRGYYQWNRGRCVSQCGQCSSRICHIQTGACLSACTPGWTGVNCAVGLLSSSTSAACSSSLSADPTSQSANPTSLSAVFEISSIENTLSDLSFTTSSDMPASNLSIILGVVIPIIILCAIALTIYFVVRTRKSPLKSNDITNVSHSGRTESPFGSEKIISDICINEEPLNCSYEVLEKQTSHEPVPNYEVLRLSTCNKSTVEQHGTEYENVYSS